MSSSRLCTRGGGVGDSSSRRHSATTEKLSQYPKKPFPCAHPIPSLGDQIRKAPHTTTSLPPALAANALFQISDRRGRLDFGLGGIMVVRRVSVRGVSDLARRWLCFVLFFPTRALLHALVYAGLPYVVPRLPMSLGFFLASRVGTCYMESQSAKSEDSGMRNRIG